MAAYKLPISFPEKLEMGGVWLGKKNFCSAFLGSVAGVCKLKWQLID